MAQSKPGDPGYDGESLQKLAAVKKANKNEAAVERLQGRDNKHTRDGGTTRRNWR